MPEGTPLKSKKGIRNSGCSPTVILRISSERAASSEALPPMNSAIAGAAASAKPPSPMTSVT